MINPLLDEEQEAGPASFSFYRSVHIHACRCGHATAVAGRFFPGKWVAGRQWQGRQWQGRQGRRPSPSTGQCMRAMLVHSPCVRACMHGGPCCSREEGTGQPIGQCMDTHDGGGWPCSCCSRGGGAESGSSRAGRVKAFLAVQASAWREHACRAEGAMQLLQQVAPLALPCAFLCHPSSPQPLSLHGMLLPL